MGKDFLKEAKRLGVRKRGKIAKSFKHEAGDILVQSCVGFRDGQPKVDLVWGDQEGQLTPAEAFEHSLGIIAAAIAAQTDAMLFEWCVVQLGLKDREAAVVLGEFRQHRLDNPNNLKAWRGQALKMLQAAEETETDNFLGGFWEKIGAQDPESVLEDFKEFRENKKANQ